nr:DUF5996 family protein [Pinirhizobacter soli]
MRVSAQRYNATRGKQRAYPSSYLSLWTIPMSRSKRDAWPDLSSLSFLQTTYEAAANLAKWDRERLEGPTGPIGHPP